MISTSGDAAGGRETVGGVEGHSVNEPSTFPLIRVSSQEHAQFSDVHDHFSRIRYNYV